jgi:ribonuclease HI
VLNIDGQRTELSGGFRYSSNNRAELTSVLVGLRTLDRPSQAQVISDSKYVGKRIELLAVNMEEEKMERRQKLGPLA